MSSTGVIIIVVLSLILIIVAAVLSFIAPGYVTSAADTAKSLMYAAGALSILVIFLLFVGGIVGSYAFISAAASAR